MRSILYLVKAARPGRALIASALVFAGFGLVSFFFRVADPSGVLLLLALMGTGFLTASGAALVQNLLRSGVEGSPLGQAPSITLTFMTGGLLALLGLLLAMTVGFLSTAVAAAIFMVGLLAAVLASRLPLLLPVLLGVEKAGLVLLGYTAYPLLSVDGMGGPLLTCPLVTSLFLIGLFSITVFLPLVGGGASEERFDIAFAVTGSLALLIAGGFLLPPVLVVWALLGGAALMLVAGTAASLAMKGSGATQRFCRFGRGPLLLFAAANLAGIGHLGGYDLLYRFAFIFPLGLVALFALLASLSSRASAELP